jgi:hypothetical protein
MVPPWAYGVSPFRGNRGSRYACRVQRVDLIVDGKLRNVGQRSDLTAFERRVLAAIQVAGTVTVRRSTPAPVPHPPPVPAIAAAHRVIFHAQVTARGMEGALSLDNTWTQAVTADKAYHTPELEHFIAACQDQHKIVRPWCDCREPDGDPKGTPFRDALAMRDTYHLSDPIGEAELVSEYDHATAAGAWLIIGNPSALTPAQLADATVKASAGLLGFIGEMLRPDPSYSGHGIPIASVCIYVGPGGGVYQSIESFWPALTAAQRDTVCVYHADALEPADWTFLRSL